MGQSHSAWNFLSKITIGGALLLGLAACETARDPELLDDPNYSAGYSDGCTTANNRISGFDDSVTRDGSRENEQAYQIGWRDGFGQCGGEDNQGITASRQDEIFTRDSEHYGSAPR